MTLLIATLLIAEPLIPDERIPQRRLELKGAERNGTVLIDWDRRSPLVVESTAAALEIVDGGLPVRRDVTVGTLRRGGLAYQRRFPEVQLKLLLLKGATMIAQPSVRLTGDAPVLQQR